MEPYASGKCGCRASMSDRGPEPFAVNLICAAQKNQNFRTALWTGCHLQLTLMCIPVCGEVGLEQHTDTDQLIRVESGRALVCMGACKEKLDVRRCLNSGDAVLLPAGTWHNICNAGNIPLKLSSLYAPPHHPRGTVHRTRAEAQQEEY